MGSETLPDTAIVDRGAFCEADFLQYVIEIFSFGFFYCLNVKLRGAALLRRSAIVQGSVLRIYFSNHAVVSFGAIIKKEPVC